MVQALGGRVEAAESGEFGRTELTLRDGGGRLLAGLPEEQSCWMSHRDAVFEPPEGFTALASTPARRSPPARTPTAASTGSSSTPRSSTRPTGPRS